MKKDWVKIDNRASELSRRNQRLKRQLYPCAVMGLSVSNLDSSSIRIEPADPIAKAQVEYRSFNLLLNVYKDALCMISLLPFLSSQL